MPQNPENHFSNMQIGSNNSDYPLEGSNGKSALGRTPSTSGQYGNINANLHARVKAFQEQRQLKRSGSVSSNKSEGEEKNIQQIVNKPLPPLPPSKQQHQHQHQQQLQQQQQQQQRLLPPLSQHSQSQTLIQSPRASAQYDLDFSVGLVNLGNSCYMNCIIQCLLGTHELSQMFLNDSYKNHINFNSKLGSKGVLAKYFSQLVHNMYRQNTPTSSFSSKKKLSGDERNAVQPLNFKIACGTINSLFRDCSQQDCQEFCQFLLDGLHEDLNQCGGNPRLKELSEEAEKIREKLSMRIASSIEWERYLTTDFSVIVDLFQGQYASQLKCQVCGRTSTTYQPFSVLSVPLPSLKSCNILDCFQEFTKVETLEKDEQWSCPDCKKRQPSTKKITITRLPRNLIIHLKRFDNMMNKNNVFVSYPHTLDLTPFWANDFDGRLPPGVTELPTRGQVPPFSYKLYAVASHTGTLYGGHYTAYVHKGSQRGWCYFDDTNWRRSRSDNECITSNAYVLFYHRVYGT